MYKPPEKLAETKGGGVSLEVGLTFFHCSCFRDMVFPIESVEEQQQLRQNCEVGAALEKDLFFFFLQGEGNVIFLSKNSFELARLLHSA